MTEKKKELLFDQFPPVSTEEWKAKVEADLKGAPFDKKLVWRTNEGFNVQPMYRAEDIADLKTTDSLPGEYPFVRGTRTDNDWLTRQEIIAGSAKEANEKALDVLTKGVNSLGFKIKDATPEELSTLLNGIDVEKVELNFSCCVKKALLFASVLVDYLKANGLEAKFRGSIDFNPYKRALKHGVEFPGDVCALAVKMLDAVKCRCLYIPGIRLCSCMGRFVAHHVDRCRCRCSGCCIPYKIQYGYLKQLFHGACQIPCGTHALGSDRKTIWRG